MGKSQLEMYKERQIELVKEFNNEIIAVKDGECLGKFNSLVEAYRAMDNSGYKEGEYIIIKCTPDDSEYTAFFANCVFFGEYCHA